MPRPILEDLTGRRIPAALITTSQGRKRWALLDFYGDPTGRFLPYRGPVPSFFGTPHRRYGQEMRRYKAAEAILKQEGFRERWIAT